MNESQNFNSKKPDVISILQNEIVEHNTYLLNKIINNRYIKYQPNTGDEDQWRRDRVKHLLEIINLIEK